MSLFDRQSTKLKWQYAIACQLSDLLEGVISTDQIYDCIESPKQSKHGQYALPVGRLQHLFKTEPWCSQTATETAEWIVSKINPNDTIEKAVAFGSFVNFTTPKSKYMETVLQEVNDDRAKYGFGPSDDSPALTITCDLPVFEPLDPNHFRGLVLATFLQRSYQRQGRQVRLMNTMNLWNDEFGYFALAYEKDGPESLTQTYHQIKQNALEDESINEQARHIRIRLEQGHETTIQQWNHLQETLIKESTDQLCLRLPFYFDGMSNVTPWHDLNPIYELFERCDKVIRNPNGEWRIDLQSTGLGTPLLRDTHGLSTTLFRDMARLYKARDTHTYHIAGQHRAQHIRQVYQALLEVGCSTSRHTSIPFGKVKSDISVQANLDTLQHTMLDILEENAGTERYDEMMAQLGQLSLTTRAKRASDTTTLAKDHADRLSTCTLMIRQCTQRRNKPLVLTSEPDIFGNSGVFLQFVHARLCGIERHLAKRGLVVENGSVHEIGTYLAQHEETGLVVDCIAQFPTVMAQALIVHDPANLVTYLFKLARMANQALYRLRIKDAQKHLALARWTLFWAVKQTLANGLTSLGIEPVSRM